MPVVELTSVFVRHASCSSGQRKLDYFDSKQRGFLIEIRASGRKTYYQRYCDERGRERQFKIGRADVLTTEQARKVGRSILARAVLGENPQLRRQELRAIPSLATFIAEKYLPFVKTYKRSWGTDETVLRIHVLPSLGKFALDEITAEHIFALIARMRSDGYAVGTSNRVVMILRYMYNLAAKWKVPGVTQNPTRGIELGQEAQRNRFLTRQEAQRLVDAITVDENRVAANAILLLMLTGARRNEITQAKWEHVLWNERKLLVPLSKSGKPRWIALSTSAMSLLDSMPKPAGCDYISLHRSRAVPVRHCGFRGGVSARVQVCRTCGCTICGTLLRASWLTRASRFTSCRRCSATPMRARRSATRTWRTTL